MTQLQAFITEIEQEAAETKKNLSVFRQKNLTGDLILNQ